jgi:3-oxoadipate enol-lactonase
MEGTIVTGDGCALAFRCDGPEDAPVLLLSNSLGTAMAMWEPQVAAFAARRRVLRYDMRGHGLSDAPPGACSIDRLARDAEELLDALGIERVDFCGLSLGGMVGQALALRAPSRIGRLVLANTSSYMGPPSAWQARIAAVRSEGMAAVAGASAGRWFTKRFRVQSPLVVAEIARVLLATNPDGYAGCCAAIRDMDLRPAAPAIAVPALVIGGTLDPATPPAHAEALAAAIPGARLRMLEAAHLSNVECPAAFAAAVLDHID